MKRNTKQCTQRNTEAKKSAHSDHDITLIALFIVDLLVFTITDIIAFISDRIGPPTILISMLFYFIYKRKTGAYIAYYIIALIGSILGFVSIAMMLLGMKFLLVYFGCARGISALAYVVTALYLAKKRCSTN